MQTKSSGLDANAIALLRALHQSSRDLFPIPLWQIRQSESRFSQPDRSARLVRSEHKHQGHSRAARGRERRQRSRSAPSAELRMEGTNSRTVRQGSEIQTPATERRQLSLFQMLFSPDKRGRPSRNQFRAAEFALPLLLKPPSPDPSYNRARLIR